MPRKFPYPLTIGTDICQISRIYDILTRGNSQYTRQFLRRLLTPQEQELHVERLKPLRSYLTQLSAIESKEEQPSEHAKNELERTPINSKAVHTQPISTWSGPLVRAVGGGSWQPTKRTILDEMKDSMRDVAVFMAGRFAAKEAAIKAHKHRRLTFHDVCIISSVSKTGDTLPPVTTISALRPQEQNQIIPLSISHDGDYATAVCMAFEPQRLMAASPATTEDSLPTADHTISEEGSTPADHTISEDRSMPADDKTVIEPVSPSTEATEEAPPKMSKNMSKRAIKKAMKEAAKEAAKEATEEAIPKVTEPKSLRPPMTEEEILRKQKREAILSTRSESIYGMPATIDPKLIIKILERAGMVHNIPNEATSQDLVDLFKGRCTAVKGYVQKMDKKGARGLVVFQFPNDLRRATKASRHGLYVMGGRQLSITPAGQLPKSIMMTYGRLHKREAHPMKMLEYGHILDMGLTPDMRPKEIRKIICGEDENSVNLAEFWTTDVFHVHKGCANLVEA